MLDLAAALKQVRQGMIPAHIYGDPEIFALERDRLFAELAETAKKALDAAAQAAAA